MVEKRDGGGKHFRDAIGPRTPGSHVIPLNPSTTEKWLEALKENPRVDRETILFTNVIDAKKRPTSVLLGPSGLKIMDIERLEDLGIPEDNVSKIVEVFNPYNRLSATVPVIVSSDKSADAIARRFLNDERGWRRFFLTSDVYQVTGQELIEETRKLIDKRENVPITVLRYGNLAAYYLRHRKK